MPGSTAATSSASAASDQRGRAVDHPVEDRSRIVVAVGVGMDRLLLEPGSSNVVVGASTMASVDHPPAAPSLGGVMPIVSCSPAAWPTMGSSDTSRRPDGFMKRAKEQMAQGRAAMQQAAQMQQGVAAGMGGCRDPARCSPRAAMAQKLNRLAQVGMEAPGAIKAPRSGRPRRQRRDHAVHRRQLPAIRRRRGGRHHDPAEPAAGPDPGPLGRTGVS